MVDILTDSKTVTVTIIQHANCVIQNIIAPTAVELGESFDISYDCLNNGATDTCYGQVFNVTVIPGSRWDQNIPASGSVTKTTTVTGITGDTTFTIEVGYSK